jgi:hypothetical protein
MNDPCRTFPKIPEHFQNTSERTITLRYDRNAPLWQNCKICDQIKGAVTRQVAREKLPSVIFQKIISQKVELGSTFRNDCGNAATRLPGVTPPVRATA